MGGGSSPPDPGRRGRTIDGVVEASGPAIARGWACVRRRHGIRRAEGMVVELHSYGRLRGDGGGSNDGGRIGGGDDAVEYVGERSSNVSATSVAVRRQNRKIATRSGRARPTR